MNKETISNILKVSGIEAEAMIYPVLDQEEFILGNGSRVWYFKDISGREMVTKEYPSWVKSEDISWIHEYMNILAQNGFPLAKAIGSPILNAKQYYGIYEYAKGELFDRSNEQHIRSMASKLRQLHDLSVDIKIQGTRNWPAVFGYKADINLLRDFDSENNTALLVPAWSWSNLLMQDKKPVVMPIHGDFRGSNMRFNQDGVSKVFDFGNSRNDFPEVDLAIALRDISDGLGINQAVFLEIYKNSGNGKVLVNPEIICASNLVLSIQECLYLQKELKKNPREKLRHALTVEVEYLGTVLTNIPQQVSILQEALL